MRVIDIQLQDCARGNGEFPHRRPLQRGEGVHPLCASRDPARLAQIRGADHDQSISKTQHHALFAGNTDLRLPQSTALVDFPH